MASNNTASIAQARKLVEQLKMEANIDRIKVARWGLLLSGCQNCSQNCRGSRDAVAGGVCGGCSSDDPNGSGWRQREMLARGGQLEASPGALLGGGKEQQSPRHLTFLGTG